MLSHEEARAFYDRFGSKQDWQRFYEDPAVAGLSVHLPLGSASSVIEFGCGTGRLAERMLARHLPTEATYLGLDVSSTMVRLAERRLRRFGARAKVLLTTGEAKLELDTSTFDLFLSVYVLDLLAENDIRELIAEAYRVLKPGGLLGLVSLTHGFTFISKIIEKIWFSAYKVRPTLVGGCRPVTLEPFLRDEWKLRHTERMITFGIPSAVLVAEKG
jgi:ubiquinone/menaquinone biosynthesis C-methylase UbiE